MSRSVLGGRPKLATLCQCPEVALSMPSRRGVFQKLGIPRAAERRHLLSVRVIRAFFTAPPSSVMGYFPEG